MSKSINDSSAAVLDQLTNVFAQTTQILEDLGPNDRVLAKDLTAMLINTKVTDLKPELIGMLISVIVNGSAEYETVQGPYGGIRKNVNKIPKPNKISKNAAKKGIIVDAPATVAAPAELTAETSADVLEPVLETAPAAEVAETTEVQETEDVSVDAGTTAVPEAETVSIQADVPTLNVVESSEDGFHSTVLSFESEAANG